MDLIARASITIADLNDPIQQGAAPSNPVEGMLWLDTSANPNQLKKYNGSGWDAVGLTPDDLDRAIRIAAPLINGTQAASTSVWTGNAPFSSLVDGQQIAFKIPYASTSTAVTLNLSLAGSGTTGAVNCYYKGATRITTHYTQGSVVRMTYFSSNLVGSTSYTGWWADGNYDSNTYDRILYARAIIAKSAITAGRLIVADGTDRFFHLAKDVPFAIDKPILYAPSAIASGASGSSNYTVYPTGISVRTNSGNSTLAFTAYKVVYIKGTLDGLLFTPTDANLYTTTPEDDGSIYMVIGQLYDTYRMTLYGQHDLFMFKDGAFKSFAQVAAEAEDMVESKIVDVRAEITNLGDSIRSEVATTYAAKDDVGTLQTQVSTMADQTSTDFTWATQTINQIIADAAANQQLTEEQFETIQTYMTFGEDGLRLGKTGNPVTVRILNDRIAFYMNETEVAYFSNNKLYVTQAHILSRLQIGKFAYEPQPNGNMSLIYTG
jgi:hypothetical protein